MSKSYLEIIQTQWESILTLYLQFEDKKPVILYDLDKHEIFAYPFEAFSAELHKKSRRSLAQQYRRAVANNHMVIFVKDGDADNMASFSVQIYQD